MNWRPTQERWGLDPSTFNTRRRVNGPAPPPSPWSTWEEYMRYTEVVVVKIVCEMRKIFSEKFKS